LAGLVYRCIKRTTITNFLICVFVPGFLYISMGSSELTHYYPLIHQPRHIIPFLPAMALLAASAGIVWWSGGRTKRVLLSIGAIGVVVMSLTAPNRLAGRWYHAQTFSAGVQLAAEHLDRNNDCKRLCAADLTEHRVKYLYAWFDCPKVEVIRNHPVTTDEWIERYAGSYVITSRFDSIGPYKPHQAHMSLTGKSMESLKTFERVARYEPAKDRLQTIVARLTGRPIPTEPELAVELWHIPESK
jgi:hypothetical protein